MPNLMFEIDGWLQPSSELGRNRHYSVNQITDILANFGVNPHTSDREESSFTNIPLFTV